VVVLDEDNALLLGLHPQTSIDALLEAVRATVTMYALQAGLDRLRRGCAADESTQRDADR
jgi:hypothetical protein